MHRPYNLLSEAVGAAPIGVIRVVVVDVVAGIDIPRIVGVAAIS